MTCTAQTLLLNLLDQTIADYDFLAGRGCLDVVLDAMKTYQSLYDNTDLILETAHRVSLDARSMVSDNGVMGWADMLSSNPMAYLRLILTMDVTVARGSFPKDSEISSVLSAHVVEFQEALNLVKKEKSEGVVNEQEKNSDDCDEPLTVSRKSSVTDIESPRDEFTASSGDILNVTAGGVILPENWGPEMLLMVPDLELQSLLASHA